MVKNIISECSEVDTAMDTLHDSECIHIDHKWSLIHHPTFQAQSSSVIHVSLLLNVYMYLSYYTYTVCTCSLYSYRHTSLLWLTHDVLRSINDLLHCNIESMFHFLIIIITGGTLFHFLIIIITGGTLFHFLIIIITGGTLFHFHMDALEDYYILNTQWWFEACGHVVSFENVDSLIATGGKYYLIVTINCGYLI